MRFTSLLSLILQVMARCMHDEMQKRYPSHALNVSSVYRRSASTASTVGFRITYDFDHNAQTYCTAINQCRPTGEILDANCASCPAPGCTKCVEGYVFTPTMLNHLESTVFPKVIARVKRILQVTAPLTSPFTFPSWRCGSIPVTSASSTIQDSDLHLVVALRAVPNSYAFACLGEQSRGRPIAGAIVIAAAQAATAAHQQAGVEATILHELLHVLGFSSNTWEPDNFPGYTHFRDASDQRISRDVAMVPVLNTARVGGAGGSFARTPDATSTFGGTATKSTQYGIATPLVLAAARKHFNCPTLAAMPVENDGGAGSVGSHWETQVVLDEMMAPSSISGDHPRLSAMTVAVLLETRWYTGVAGWEDEVEHAVPYGRWAGCPHATMSVCSANPNLGWCARDIEMDQPTAVAAGLSQGQTIAVPPTAAAEACSWDGMQKGGCLDGSLYEWSRCGWRIGYANRFCTSPSTPVSVTGEAMGPSSRCLGGRLGRVGSTVVSNGFCFVHRSACGDSITQLVPPSDNWSMRLKSTMSFSRTPLRTSGACPTADSSSLKSHPVPGCGTRALPMVPMAPSCCSTWPQVCARRARCRAPPQSPSAGSRLRSRTQRHSCWRQPPRRPPTS